MEASTDRFLSASDRQLECLRDIVRVYVVHGLHPLVRELQRLAVGNAGEHIRIEMAGGIQRLPPRTDKVPRMQNHGTGNASHTAVDQKLLDRGFLDSVIAERMSRRVFGYRNTCRATVHPHCATMEQERLTRL